MMSNSLRPDRESASDYAALRSRLGFAVTASPRIRLDLIGRKVAPAPKPAPVVEPPPVEPPPIVLSFWTPFNFIKEPSWRAIVKLVALKHGVDAADIIGPHRLRHFVRARQEAMYLVHSHCGLSLVEIAYRFQRDHTTVLHSVRKIKRLRREMEATKC